MVLNVAPSMANRSLEAAPVSRMLPLSRVYFDQPQVGSVRPYTISVILDKQICQLKSQKPWTATRPVADVLVLSKHSVKVLGDA